MYSKSNKEKYLVTLENENFHWLEAREYTKETYERPDSKFSRVLDMVESL